jgi:ribosomal protein S18 acetylase RimI-like enzyme
VPQRRLLDEVAANAVPAAVTRLVDGWLAKSSPHLPFRRASSVLPPMAAGADPVRVEAALASLEEWYGERGLRVAVHVSFGDAAAEPLDELLAARGYEVEAPVVVKAGATTDVLARCLAEPHDDVDAEVTVGIDDDWEGADLEIDDADEPEAARTASFLRILQPLGVGALVAVARIGGRPAGVGFGVVERGHLGIVGLRTAADRRRRGVATAVLGALVGSAVERDVTRTYLQVETGNAAARSLFVGLGYERSHRYHYRVSAPV